MVPIVIAIISLVIAAFIVALVLLSRKQKRAEAAFFDLDALPADTTAATRARLSEALEQAPVSPYW